MVNGKPKHVIGYMKDFLFSPEQARTPLAKLSGGERGRLMLAQALAKPSNLLVLDEPTNDLDMETLDVLEDMLADYAGTVLLISHDRDFLDRLVSGVIVPEGDGRWTEYAGGYSDMLTQRGADLTRAPQAESRSGEGNRAATCKALRPVEAEAQDDLQGQARAGNAAEDHRQAAAGSRKRSSSSLTIRSFMPATAPASKRPPPSSANSSTRSPRRKNSGWRSRSCGKNWPARDRGKRAAAPGNFAGCHGPADAASGTSSVTTLKPVSVHGLNSVTIATSVASRPRAIRMRPMRGLLWRASNVYQRPPR